MKTPLRMCALLVTATVTIAPSPVAARAASIAWTEQGVQIAAPTWGTSSPQFADGYRDAGDRFLVKVRGAGTLVSSVAADAIWAWQAPIVLWDEGGSGLAPAFAPDGEGGFFMHGDYEDVGNVTTYRQHFGAGNGVEDWGSPPLGVTTGTLYCSQSMLADGAGGVWLAVNGLYGGHSSAGLFLQHWAPNGTTMPGWNDPGRIVGTGDGVNPVLASDGAGGVIVTYQSAGQCFALRLQPGGAIAPGWASPGLALGAADPGTMTTYGPKPFLVPSGPDHFLAIWSHTTGFCRAQRFGADGTLDPAWPAAGIVLQDGQAWPGALPWPVSALPDGQGGVHWLWWGTGPRWTHVLANGAFAPGFDVAGISPKDAAGVYATAAHRGLFAAAPALDGGLIFAWDDERAGSPPSIRLRWLLADGTADPNEPDAGRVIPGPGADGSILGLIPDGAGGAHAVWTRYVGNDDSPVYMNHMARTGLVLAVNPPAASRTLSLESPWPNPARDAITVRCALPDDRPATIALYDVGGRRVRSAGVSGAGVHVTNLAALDGLSPGVYLLRLAHGSEQRSTRVALVR